MKENQTELSRRGFLAASLSCLVSAGVGGLAPTAFAQTATKGEAAEKKEVIYRSLGRSGIKVPVVGMGVMNSSNPEVVQASYELGIRFFDTAAYYQYGRNEQMVGRVIGKLGVRDKVVIATKILPTGQRRGLDEKAIKQKFLTAFEGSLKRLNTDYVDILYLHDVSSEEDVNDRGIIEAMTELKDKGKVKLVGVSSHSNMANVINAITALGFHDIVLSAINVSMSDDTALLNAIKNAGAKGVAIVAMKTQVGGGGFPNPEALQEYSGETLATATLKWALNVDGVCMAIPGYTNFEHMRQDFSVANDLEYTEEERKLLSDNSIKLGFGFCRQCRSCLATCPHGADVPTLMRTHMYATRYGNFHHARTVLNDISQGQGLGACSSCSECSARCANAVDIPSRISDLKVIYA
jgi:predicted aldo/keto reductase-like oxidoreductase